MAIKKKKKADEGAPAWMVTFGDMMSLLLCFFVILVSMSEFKQTERFQKVMESIKRAFGYKGGAGWTPGLVAPNNTLDKQMAQLIMRKWQLQIGKSTEEGIEGENPSVKTVREGLEYTVGGRVSFEPGRAKLLEQAKEQLGIFADVIRGMNNKIRIRGHAARKAPAQYHPFAGLDDLSYARALAVKKYFIALGIRPERITCEACGDNEPLRTQTYDESGRAYNRRVSIVVTENLVEEYIGAPAQKNQGDLANG